MLIGVGVRLSVSGTWTFFPSRLEFTKFVSLLTGWWITASSTSVFVMSRTLDCVFGYFNNFASLSLFTSGLHAKVDMYSVERAKHRLVQCHMVGMDSSGMLSKIVQSRECFPTMTREWSFSSMFSNCQHYIPAKKSGSYRTCLARCSDLVKTLSQSPNPLHLNIFPPLTPTGTIGAPSGVKVTLCSTCRPPPWLEGGGEGI